MNSERICSKEIYYITRSMSILFIQICALSEAKGMVIIMDIIKSAINTWLTECGDYDGILKDNSKFMGILREYMNFYNSESTGTEIPFTEKELKDAAHGEVAYLYDSSAEILPDGMRLCLNTISNMMYEKFTYLSYEIKIIGNEFKFDITVDNSKIKNGGVFRASVNDIFNDFIGEEKFTRGIVIRDFDELKRVFAVMSFGLFGLSQFIVGLYPAEYLDFLKNTDFLEKYEQMNLLCNRDASTYQKDEKRSVRKMLEKYDGVTVKYYSADKFYKVSKTFGNYVVSLEVEIRYKSLLSFCMGIRLNGELLYVSTANNWVEKYGSGKHLHSLQFQSTEELQNMIDFMMKYLDIFASYYYKEN